MRVSSLRRRRASSRRARELFPRRTCALAKADLPHAVVEVARAAQDFDFNAHEKNRQVAPIDFRKAHGVLLRGENHFRLALLAAIDGVQNLLLSEAMMIGEALGI